jgi:hypothetical protein
MSWCNLVLERPLCIFGDITKRPCGNGQQASLIARPEYLLLLSCLHPKSLLLSAFPLSHM